MNSITFKSERKEIRTLKTYRHVYFWISLVPKDHLFWHSTSNKLLTRVTGISMFLHTHFSTNTSRNKFVELNIRKHSYLDNFGLRGCHVRSMEIYRCIQPKSSHIFLHWSNSMPKVLTKLARLNQSHLYSNTVAWPTVAWRGWYWLRRRRSRSSSIHYLLSL